MAKPICDNRLRARRNLAVKLQLLENEAYTYGLCRTARKINSAIQEIGWEINQQIDKES